MLYLTSTGILPVEILAEMFIMAKVGRSPPRKNWYDLDTMNLDFYGNPNYVNYNEEYPLYKALRLVCKHFSQMATPLLFGNVFLLSNIQVSRPIYVYFLSLAGNENWMMSTLMSVIHVKQALADPILEPGEPRPHLQDSAPCETCWSNHARGTEPYLPAYGNIKEFRADNEGSFDRYKCPGPNYGPLAQLPTGVADFYSRYQRWHKAEKT